MNPNQQQSPINVTPPRPTQTPMPGAPLESQGMPAGVDPMAPEMATPEERAQIEELLAVTKDKMSELQTAKFSSQNARESAKLDALKAVFTMMQEAGVDLTSQESVAAFIDKMKAANPAMAQDFEAALVALLGEDGEIPSGEVAPVPPTDPSIPPGSASPEGVMSQGTEPVNNETLSQDIRGSIPPQA